MTDQNEGNGFVMDWLRGQYGEILPTPLIMHVTAEQALEDLRKAVEARGQKLDVPSKGRSLEGLYNLALTFAHAMRLSEVLAGRYNPEDVIEKKLYEAVVQEGEMVSLRPAGQNDLTFTSFSPVLRYMKDGRWMVGDPTYGKHQIIEDKGNAGEAVKKAQMCYMTWSKEDDVEFEKMAARALAQTGQSLYHDYWLCLFEDQEWFSPAEEYTLYLLGHHNTMRLQTPDITRILETERVRAVRIADALSRMNRATVSVPSPDELLAWLEKEKTDGGEVPGIRKWPEAGDIDWIPNRTLVGVLAHWSVDGTEYDIVRRGALLLLLPVAGKSGYGKAAVETGWETEMEPWVRQACPGREALLEWFCWKLRNSK